MGALATEPGACALCGSDSGAERLAAGWDFEYGTTDQEFTLWRCPCGGVYLNPRPAPEALGQIYPPTYYAYGFTEKLGPLVRRFKAMADRSKVQQYVDYLKPGSRVLDIGCGDGHLLADLRDAAGFDLELSGIEFSGDAIEEARKIGVDVAEGRAEEVSLPESSFDLVIINQLIEHVRDPGALLHSIAGWLEPGGHVFVETPNIDSVDARLFRRRYWGGYHIPRHFHLFDTRTLTGLASKQGLEQVSLKPLVCPQFWIISAANWFAAKGRRAVGEKLFDPLSPVWLIPFTAIELLHVRLWWTSNQQLVAQRPV